MSVKQLVAAMGATIQLVATTAFVHQVIDWQVITVHVMVSHGRHHWLQTDCGPHVQLDNL